MLGTQAGLKAEVVCKAEDLMRQLAERDEALVELREAAALHQRELQLLSDQTEAANTRAEEAVENAKQAQVDLAGHRVAMDIERASLRQQTAELGERLAVLQEEHAEVTNEVLANTSAVQQKVEELGENLAAMTGRVVAAEDRASAAEDRAIAAGDRATAAESKVTAADARAVAAAMESRVATAEWNAPVACARPARVDIRERQQDTFAKRALDQANRVHLSVARCAEANAALDRMCDRASAVPVATGEFARFCARPRQSVFAAARRVVEAEMSAEETNVAELAIDNIRLRQFFTASEVTSDAATKATTTAREEKGEEEEEEEGEEEQEEEVEQQYFHERETYRRPRSYLTGVPAARLDTGGLETTYRRISVAERARQQADANLENVTVAQVERRDMSDHHEGRASMEGRDEIGARMERLWPSSAALEEWRQRQRQRRRARDSAVTNELAGVAGRAGGERWSVVSEEGSNGTTGSLGRRVASLEQWRDTAQGQLRRIWGDARTAAGDFAHQRGCVMLSGERASSRRPEGGLPRGPVPVTIVR